MKHENRTLTTVRHRAKRLFALTLALIMVVCFLPAPVKAEELGNDSYYFVLVQNGKVNSGYVEGLVTAYGEDGTRWYDIDSDHIVTSMPTDGYPLHVYDPLVAYGDGVYYNGYVWASGSSVFWGNTSKEINCISLHDTNLNDYDGPETPEQFSLEPDKDVDVYCGSLEFSSGCAWGRIRIFVDDELKAENTNKGEDGKAMFTLPKGSYSVAYDGFEIGEDGYGDTVYTFIYHITSNKPDTPDPDNPVNPDNPDKLPQTAPEPPVVIRATSDSLTVKTVRGVEFSIDGKNWQTSGVFTNLEPETTYVIQARKPATTKHNASPSSTTVANTKSLKSNPLPWLYNLKILKVLDTITNARQTVTAWNPWQVRTIWTPWWVRR